MKKKKKKKKHFMLKNECVFHWVSAKVKAAKAPTSRENVWQGENIILSRTIILI